MEEINEENSSANEYDERDDELYLRAYLGQLDPTNSNYQSNGIFLKKIFIFFHS